MTATMEGTTDAVTELPRLLPPRDGTPGGGSGGGSGGGQAHDFRAHAMRHGMLTYRDRIGTLIGEAEAAGLTGRGGAAFPAYRKLHHHMRELRRLR